MNELEVVTRVAESNPLVGGATIVTLVVAILLLLLKAYNYLKADTGLTSAQQSVIMVLRQEIDRLSKAVADGAQREQDMRKQLNEALDELTRLKRATLSPP